MSNKEFINNLSSTYADVRKLDAKSIDAKTIKLNGTNIEDLLSSGGSNIIIEDGREIKTKYDIWEHAAVENEDGSVTVKNLYVPDTSGWNDENIGGEINTNWDDFTQYVSPSFRIPRYYSASDKKLIVCNFDGTSFGENYEHCVIDFDKIVNGEGLFHTFFNKMPTDELYFTLDFYTLDFQETYRNFPNLVNGRSMFSTYGLEGADYGPNLWYPITIDFQGTANPAFPSLRLGNDMFSGVCLNGLELNDFPELEFGENMFADTKTNILVSYKYNVKPLHAFDKLRGASYMFCGVEPTILQLDVVWNKTLPSLSTAVCMFAYTKMKKFVGDLPSLTYAANMFDNTSLECFSGRLPKLICACQMFTNCKLDAQSVLHILDSIPTREDDPRIWWDEVYNEETGEFEMKEIMHDRPMMDSGEEVEGVTKIGINCLDDEDSKNQFAQEMGYESWSEVVSAFIDEKNWFVDWQFNGEVPTNYSLRGGATITNPIWAKLREVEPKKDEKGKKLPFSYEYTSQDGKHFYHLDWFHESLGYTGYTQFDSLEAAEEHYGLIRKENSITTKEKEV